MTTAPSRPGATVTDAGVAFRVWAPDHTQLTVEFEGEAIPALSLEPEGDGFFAGRSTAAKAGSLYRFRLGDSQRYADPYSRFQPDGPHGPSRVVDPAAYAWDDAQWRGLDPQRQVLYELHIGTFTAAGTYEAASEHLEYLRDLGITCIELMPVNEFVGRFGWGYDGVNWFAPYHHYGEPDDLRRFIGRAHAVGIGVILDVIYNHFGHDGNILPHYGARYLTDAYANPWGAAPNFALEPMRRMVIDNAVAWISEFHFDGLRLDAIQSVHDPDYPTLLAAIATEARAAAGARRIMIAGEDYLQRTPLLGAAGAGGAGIDHLWNDDFHHSARVALTGNHYGFFRNYRGTAQELVASLQCGFLFQGQYDAWFGKERGSPVTDEVLTSFIAFTQNHDAVGNTLDGKRLPSLVSAARYRAVTAVMLLGPQTPLLFMGQEFNASTPFPYFADYPGESRELWIGRKREAAQFDQYQDPAAQLQILNPCSIDTLHAATLNHAERESNQATLHLFTDLIALRKRYATPLSRRDLNTAVLTRDAFVLRWRAPDGAECLLMVNLGPQVESRAWAEPLLAPPLGRQWQSIWASEAPRYGGMGAVKALTPEGWQLAAASAQLMVAAS